MTKTDLQITKQILESFERLKIDRVVSALRNEPTENTEIEFYPVIIEAKDSLERLLRMVVLLGGWMREETIQIRKEVDTEVWTSIFENLNSLNAWKDNLFPLNEEEGLERMQSLLSYLAKIQFYLAKWLVYLYKSYNSDVKQMITFIFKDEIENLNGT